MIGNSFAVRVGFGEGIVNYLRCLLISEPYLGKKHRGLVFLEVTVFFFEHELFQFKPETAPDIKTEIGCSVRNFQRIVYLSIVIVALYIIPVK